MNTSNGPSKVSVLPAPLVSLVQGLAQFPRSLPALHAGRVDHDGNVRHAALQGGYHVMQGRGAQRGDHADRARQQRQRAFSARLEQALGFQFGLELQELLERWEALFETA